MANVRHLSSLNMIQMNELRKVITKQIYILPLATTCYCKKWQIKSKYFNKPESGRKRRDFSLSLSVFMFVMFYDVLFGGALVGIYILNVLMSIAHFLVSALHFLAPLALSMRIKFFFSLCKMPLASWMCVCCEIKTEIFIFALQHQHINGNLIVRSE